MQRQHVKMTMTAVWLLAVCAVGLASGGMSIYAWAVMALAALLPPYLLMRLWSEPPQTTSESIRTALR